MPGPSRHKAGRRKNDSLTVPQLITVPDRVEFHCLSTVDVEQLRQADTSIPLTISSMCFGAVIPSAPQLYEACAVITSGGEIVTMHLVYVGISTLCLGVGSVMAWVVHVRKSNARKILRELQMRRRMQIR